MEKAKKPGQTDPCIKDNITWAKNMGRGCITGMMDPATQATGKTTKSLERAHTSGSMADNTPGTGSITTCTAKVGITGRMDVITRECISTTRNMATECTSG